MPDFYPEGSTVLPTDGELRSLHKIASLAAISGGGGGGLSGTGSPEGAVTAVAGTTYVDTATGALYWKGSGSGNTGWLP